MKESKLIGFNSNMLVNTIIQPLIAEQTNRFIEYAKEKVVTIARSIQSHGYSMDRTGNLLDSLCWVVSYDGSMKGCGFYREGRASRDSYLHELFPEDFYSLYPVYGHALAQDFIDRWGKRSGKGQWQVAFGILAPYWGYWEVGHKNVLTHKIEKFAVMAEVYDTVSQELKPNKIEFYRSRPSYSKPKMQKTRNRLSRNPYAERRHYDRWKRRS